MPVNGGDVNAIIRLASQLEPTDPNSYLSLLTHALVVGFVAHGIDRAEACRAVNRAFDDNPPEYVVLVNPGLDS